ncbi:MAG: carboxypeptidase-like regulatory domain-containing protein [Bacteroidales bacterium]
MIILIHGLIASAQVKLTGQVSDSLTGQPVAGASIQLLENNTEFSITDSAGQFSIEAPSLPCVLVVRHISYDVLLYEVNKGSVLPLEIVLEQNENIIGEVSVKVPVDKAGDNALRKISFSKNEIDMMTTGFGEADIIRSLQNLPGIQKSSEVNAALNVRGTGHGSNRISFDGQDLHNSYHLLGIAPMFNPDIIERAVLQKSGFSAAEGNALSSFLEVESRDPDLYDNSFTASLCNLSAKMQFEGPLKEGRASVMAAARYSFFDLVAGVYEQLHGEKEDFNPLPDYKLYDLFLRLHFRLKNDWRANLTAFGTADRFLYETGSLKLRTDWENQLYSLNLSRTLDTSSYIKIHTGVSGYNFSGSYNPSWNIIRSNDMLSWDSRVDYSSSLKKGWQWSAGLFNSLRYYYIHSEERSLSYILRSAATTDYSVYSGIYGNLTVPLGKRLEMQGGLRLIHYLNTKSMVRMAPRLKLNFKQGQFDLNLSYDRTWQFAHLISPLGFNMPADLWYPADNNSPPQRADQYALHINRKWGSIETDFGVFYKDMEGLSEQGPEAEMISFDPVDALVYGRGEAVGFEAALKFSSRYLRAEMFYTWSRSRRYFDLINDGMPFSPAWDLPHQLDINMGGPVADKWRWNISWFIVSGQVITMPTGYVFLPHGPEVMPYPLYTERYNFRMPPAHRMDLSLLYRSDHKWGSTSLSMGVYNVYHNSNPYYLYFTIDDLPDGAMAVTPRKLSIFPFTPFISLKIHRK